MASLVPKWLRVLRAISLVSAAILIAVTVVVAVSAERQRAATDAEQGLLATAESQRQALDNYFARARAVILLTSRNPALAALYDGSAVPEARALRDVTDALGYLERLYPDAIGEACLIDRTGTEAARVVRGKIAREEELSSEEEGAGFFAPTFAAETGQVHQALPYESPDTGEWVISNSTPLPTRAARAEAIVHFEVTIESFRRAAALTDRRHVTQVVDLATRRVVLDSRQSQRVGAPLGRRADPALVSKLATASQPGGTSRLTTVDGVPAAIGGLAHDAGNANRWVVIVTPAAGGVNDDFELSLGVILLLVAALASASIGVLSFRFSSAALAEAALTDTLTGLPNRALLRDRIERAVVRTRRSGRHLAVMLLDLDRFKEINDALGHHQGDRLLQVLAVRLQEAIRDQDSVARLGGDEFAVLVEDLADGQVAIDLARRIEAELSRPVLLGEVEVEVGVSIGIAVHPEHADDVDTLLQRADVAMYAAKRLRQGWMLYDPAQDPYTAERLALVGDLRRAIEHRQPHLHYQPKYRLDGLEMCGVEALVRWDHPQRGRLTPDEFIPLAEHTGLIKPLTALVLDLALTQVAVWRAQGHSVPVAVNLSARSLLDAELPAQIGAMLRLHDLGPEMLALEITESVIMEDPDRAMAVLESLSEMGIRLAIDDFGTGYSSLAYLKRLPVSELKIDKGFVLNMATSKDDAAIVRSTIDLGHNLGLAIVAEGVEDSAALDTLANLACSSAQGFFLARPQSAESVTALLSGSPSPTAMSTD